jgi:hypothetical protein
MSAAKVRIAAVATLIYASAAIPQHVIEVSYQFCAGWINLEPYATNFVLAQSIDGIDPIWNPGVLFRHFKSTLHTQAPHFLQDNEIVTSSSLANSPVRCSISIYPHFSLMLRIVFVEESTHLRDIGIVYHKLLIYAVDRPVDLTDQGDHRLYVEVPAPADWSKSTKLWLSLDMQMFIEAHICSAASHSWKPLTFQTYTAGGGPRRIYRLQSRNFLPSDRWVVVDGGPKHSCMCKSASSPRLDDLAVDPRRLTLFPLRW